MNKNKYLISALYWLITQAKYDLWDAWDDWHYLIVLDYSKENHECFWDNLIWKCPSPQYFYEWELRNNR